ncbi:MAG: hypothetical protein L6W00_30540 [Lentisphaeria bacterium]|nr:MAG: hypothetical protein L6W00_30540 [Lentisphaeria bacterium]
MITQTEKFCRDALKPISPSLLVLAVGEMLWNELPTGRMCGGASGNYIYHVKRTGANAQRHVESRAAIWKLLQLATGARFRILDVNLRQHFYEHDILEHSLQSANVLKLNDEELPVLARMFGFPDTGEEAVIPLMKKFELAYCIYTCGALWRCSP